MATGPGYKVNLKRRRQQKTNYYLRRNLLKSKKIRMVVRSSNKHIHVQFVEAKPDGDITLAMAGSKHLEEFGWKGACSNIPAAYLTGYLAGVRALKAGIKEAILDIGLNPPQSGTRIFAALKGAVDAGLTIPHREEKLPEQDRVEGKHIAAYGEMLSAEDPEKYQRQFSQYVKKGLKPEEIPKYFSATLKAIKKKA